MQHPHMEQQPHMEPPPGYAEKQMPPLPMGSTIIPTAEPSMPTTVRIAGYEDRGHTSYRIETQLGPDATPIVASHRYSDFLQLHEASGRSDVFPVPKRLFHTDSVKATRSKALERYLQGALAECPAGALASGGPALRAFLLGPAAAAAAAAPKPSDEATPRLQRIEPSMPRGLCGTLQEACRAFPVRFVILDNSGSMASGDGSRIVRDGAGRPRVVKCTRWQELGEDAVSLARVAEALAPLGRTDFLLLNPTQGYSAVSVGGECDAVPLLGGRRGGAADVQSIAQTSPRGGTPLTEAVQRVAAQVEPAAEGLRARGQQCTVVIATDGLPNDKGSFAQAVRRLQQLPVWLVVRLCTDDDGVVSYWNELDAELEAPLEVLDDVRGEAQEVNAHNGWLTYGPALHLARLFGLPGKVFDALDEERLLPSQAKELVEAVLGCAPLPEPQLDRAAFISEVRRAAAAAAQTYDLLACRMRPWVDANALDRSVRDANGEGCAIMQCGARGVRGRV